MRLLDYEQPFKEAVGTFEALRKLGFSSNDIFFGVATPRSDIVQVFVALKAQGKEFTVTLGVVKGTATQVTDTWKTLAERIVAGQIPQADLDHVWQNCLVRQHAEDFVAALKNKGLVLPLSLN